MDQRKKAIGIFAIGLAFIITAVGAFYCGVYIGKNSNVKATNTVETSNSIKNDNAVESNNIIVNKVVENKSENTIEIKIDENEVAKQISDLNKEIMNYKYKISYNLRSITEAFYEYKYEIDFENTEITQEWKYYWLTLNNVKDSSKTTITMNDTIKNDLIELLKKFSVSDLLSEEENEKTITINKATAKINKSTKEIEFSFDEEDTYGLIKKLEDIFKK